MNTYNDNNKVVQSNDLIRSANWTLTNTQLKLFKVIVSCIDTSEFYENNQTPTVYIRNRDLQKYVSEKSISNYIYVKNQLEELRKASISIKIKNKKGKLVEYNTGLISGFSYPLDAEEAIHEINFDKRIVPYLIDLKEKFTQYEVLILKKFNSKYSLLLFEYLLSLYNQYDSDVHVIDVEVLRKITNTTDKYDRAEAFKRKVLEVAKTDINRANAKFLMDYEPVKNGRKIKAYRFKLRPRNSSLEEDFYDVRYIVAKEEKEIF